MENRKNDRITSDQLLLVAAFVQVDTIRGNRYLDDAGKILNKLEDDFPERQWAVEGMQLQNSNSSVRQVRVNNTRIWINFVEPRSVGFIAQQSKKLIQEICDIITVTKFSRIGLGVQYVYGLSNWLEVATAIQSKVLSKELLKRLPTEHTKDEPGFEIFLPLQTDTQRIHLRLSPVQLAEGLAVDQSLPERGVMFDADFHIASTVESNRLGQFFRDAEVWLKGPLLSIVDDVVGEK